MKIFKNSLLIIVGLLFFSCTEDKVISLEDNKFNKPIPQVPVNTDYTVGAIYTKFESKFDRISNTVVETPFIGIYDGNSADPIRYEEHVKQAKKTAGVDFFIFSLRSANFVADTTYIHDLQKNHLENTPIPEQMKFAFSYTFNPQGSTNTSPFQESSTTEDQFLKDFELMKDFFDEKKYPNYMRINNKVVVYMNNSYNLFAYDNTALYKKLRARMLADYKVELYLIGMQLEWTPTLRFFTKGYNRFEGCVDALTYTNYANILLVDYDRQLFFHKYVNLAWSYHKETLAKYNIEFVPTISPSYNPKINNESSTNYVIAKNADWFKANCNIARKTSGANKLVIIDSFNNWNLNTQIESATSYGDEYLKILRSEFKVN